MNTRDTFGFAAKGSWFEVEELSDRITTNEDGSYEQQFEKVGYDIYKDPVTDDGTKKSLKGLMCVTHENGEYVVHTQCTPEQESTGLLQTIYENGKLYNQVTLAEIRKRIASII